MPPEPQIPSVMLLGLQPPKGANYGELGSRLFAIAPACAFSVSISAASHGTGKADCGASVKAGRLSLGAEHLANRGRRHRGKRHREGAVAGVERRESGQAGGRSGGRRRSCEGRSGRQSRFRRLRRRRGDIGRDRAITGGLEVRRLDVLIEEDLPAKEDNDEEMNQRRYRQEPRGEDGLEEPIKMRFGRVWHWFWLGGMEAPPMGGPTG